MRWWKDVKKKLANLRLAQWALSQEKAWEPQITWQRLRYVALAAAVLFVVGWGPAERALKHYVGQNHVQPLLVEKVRLVNAPGWMPAGLRWRIQKLVAEQVSADPTDKQSLGYAVGALQHCGWVESVDQVQRVKEGVEVSARYRRPAVIVEQKDGYRLVDANNVCLPGLYRAEQASRIKLPLIVGAAPGPQHDGEQWPGMQVMAALNLLRLLADQPYLNQVQAVDVSQHDQRGRLRLALVTQKGMVVWGLPSGQEQLIEPTAQVKKAWLADVYRQCGSIDAGGRVVDIYGPAVFVHDNPPQDPAQQTAAVWKP